MTTSQLKDELRRQDDERQSARYARLFGTPPRRGREVHADVNGGWWMVSLREGQILYEGNSEAEATRIHQHAQRRGQNSVKVGSIFGSY